MAAFAFDQNDGEVASSEREPLLHASRHRYLHTAARNTMPLAKNPHGSGAVVDLKDTRPHGSVGIGYPACDSDLPAGKSAWVAVNLFYALTRGAPGKQNRRQTHQQHGEQFEASARHTIHLRT